VKKEYSILTGRKKFQTAGKNDEKEKLSGGNRDRVAIKNNSQGWKRRLCGSHGCV